MTTRRQILKHLAWSAGTVACTSLAAPARLFAQPDPPPPGKKVAFLVGVDKYLKPGFSPLNCCERDVLEVAKELKSLGFGPIEVLLGSGTRETQATRANIEQTLQRLVQTLGQNDLIVVMLSGHGQQFGPQGQGDAYFCPVDAVDRQAETLVSLSNVTDQILAKNVGKRLVLVDACRDVPKDPNKGAKGIQGRQITLAEDTGIFFSCRAGEQSFTDNELNHSLFTYCVLEALRGKGATGGEVSWDGMIHHVKTRMAMAEMRNRVPKGRHQSPINAGSVDHTVLGRIQPGGATEMIGTRAGEERDDNGLKLKLVWCPPGMFMMGSPETEEGHEANEAQLPVRLADGFWIGKYEVTQGEWKQVMRTTPWGGQDAVREGARHAAVFVDSVGARGFVRALTERERESGRLPKGWSYALPTEAQWEYACRAGTQTPFHFDGNSRRLSEFAWWGGFDDGNCANERFAHAVGEKKPNAWGLHDMHGNVWEWCVDPQSPEVAPTTRGGSWADTVLSCRASRRGFPPKDYRQYNLGFRVVLVRSPAEP